MIQDIKPHQLNNHYDPSVKACAMHRVIHMMGDRVLIASTQEGTREVLTLPTAQQLVTGEAFSSLLYLFSLDGEPYFLLRDPQEHALPGFSYLSVRSLRRKGDIDQPLIFALWTAYHLSFWYAKNRYCGCCASPLIPAEDERALVCERCNNRVYPRINPAVIVGVTHQDQLLMTKYADRPLACYALVAGFTEIGETLEECVAREVMEETGLRVKNIRYYKSQPWGIAQDILAGFYCDVDGDPTIQIDRHELKEGSWFPREEIMGQPDDFSLTNEMMMEFREGNEPRGNEKTGAER